MALNSQLSTLNSKGDAQASPLALLRRLEWRVRHAVENVLSGEYRSAFRGRGMEFDQVVKYEFGDDVRDIDWNVTARLGEPYRKKFVEEREVTVMLVLEDTPSLQFGSGEQSKREALLELAGLVMLLGAVNRDRVGFLHVKPDGYTLREPVRGRGPILHAAASLLGAPAPSLHPQSSALSPSAIPWRLLSRAAPKHSILIWLGDFAPRPEPDGWAVMRKRYQPMGFRVEDLWERALPEGDAFAAYDPVSGQLVTLENSAAERLAHARWREARDESWRNLFPDTLTRLVVGTDEDRLEALVRFFHARQSRR
ncbi:DUF58 domain-containing protein [Rariglobus hedericola]|uniref:DUF58 domain-containing protein n=1 Tax=Rariglobus hedericola TaxID=2597822 RepID=A0A556QQ41_9BACT|nr:DUF58 domain-containing protein [Rariglobus hedericola]TSJ78765.1 DUF58 domain-containing protein [Rariglobus hedericola]